MTVSAAPAAAQALSPDRHDASFDHRDPGNPPAAWDRLLSEVPEGGLPASQTPIVVVAAHPDDETLGCGGILALGSDRGHPMTVIIATDGEASHPDSPTHPPALLARIRREEAARAVAELAPGCRLVQLGLPDGQLSARRKALREAISEAVGTGPAWVLSPWEQDRHPDHAACARAARQVAEIRSDCTVGEFPIWAWHWADPAGHDLPSGAMRRIRVGAAARARRWQALRCYRSQIYPLSSNPGDEALLADRVTAHFDRSFDILIDPHGCASRPEYFEAMYAASDDPWNAESRWYERRKRDLVLASLPRPHFAAAFEPGCGPGHLTAGLAGRCDTVLAVDAAPRAVALTTSATAAWPGVFVRVADIREQWPRGRFDLVILSEIGYYLTDLDRLAADVVRCLTDDGVVLLCHRRHPTVEHRHSAHTVHEAVRRGTGLHLVASHQEEDFLLDVLAVSAASVARSDGLLD